MWCVHACVHKRAYVCVCACARVYMYVCVAAAAFAVVPCYLGFCCCLDLFGSGCLLPNGLTKISAV